MRYNSNLSPREPMASDDSNMLVPSACWCLYSCPAHAAVTRDTLREGRIGTKFCAHPKGGAKTEKPAKLRDQNAEPPQPSRPPHSSLRGPWAEAIHGLR